MIVLASSTEILSLLRPLTGLPANKGSHEIKSHINYADRGKKVMTGVSNVPVFKLCSSVLVSQIREDSLTFL